MRRAILILVGAWIGIGLLLSGADAITDAIARGASPVGPIVVVAATVLVAAAIVVGRARRFARAGWGRRAAVVVAATVVVAGGVTGAAIATTEVRRPDPAVLAALKPACTGAAVREAAPFRPGSTGANDLVVLGADGGEIRWTGDARAAWRPVTVVDTELVACVDDRDTLAVDETCQYRGGPPITRYRAWRDVRVVAPVSAEEVARFTVLEVAGDCPDRAPKDQVELSAHVLWPTMEAHLAGLVATGRFANPDPETDAVAP